MDVTPALAEGVKPVTGYGPGFFRIAGEVIEGAILLYPERVLPAPVAQYALFTAEHLRALCDDKLDSAAPQILLLGVGAEFTALPPRELRDCARQLGIVLEVMDSRAACRTWNVLLAEGRRVAAIIWPV